MRKRNFKLTCILLVVFSLFLGLIVYTTNKEFFDVLIDSENSNYKTENTSLVLTTGTYTSSDNHAITIGEDGTILYDGTYSLTASNSSNGNVLTGKIGTNNKSVTFYQLNSQAIVSNTVVNYTHDGETVYLYDYTLFTLSNVTPRTDESGSYEVWTNGSKAGTYSDLQHAINSAESGSTIRITKSMDIEAGAYISGKTLTIGGMGNTITRNNYINSIFVVESDATLNLKNLTIDGGASNFEVDYDAVTFSGSTIPLKEGTLDNEPQMNAPAIVSKGTINGTRLNVNNNYTLTRGSAILILSGNVTLQNSNLNHNYGSSQGAAISIGRDLYQNETIYPIKTVIIEDSNINNNYTSGGNGGAIYVHNTDTIKINNTNFYGNTANSYSAGGGAIWFSRYTVSVAEKNGLDYIKAYIDNCTFDKNYSGNDGYAIQNEGAELYITNTTFKNNTGTHPTSSVGTVSCMLDGSRNYNVVIDNCVFESNYGGASSFGDHGTLVDLKLTNTTFKNNAGKMSILLYSANANISNCTFENETVSTTVLDVRTYISVEKNSLYLPNTVTLSNVAFNNTNGPTDILVRKNGHNLTYNDPTVVIKDTVEGDVSIWDETNLSVDGTLVGNVTKDSTITDTDIVIKEGAKVEGNISSNENTYTIMLQYAKADGKNTVKFLYLEKDKTYTEKELYLLHLVGTENKKLEYYTDSAMTKSWNLTATGNLSIYAKFAEHTHSYDGTLVVHENTIYEQCECGYLGKKLYLKAPEKLVYDTNSKPVIVVNELGINNYEIKYQQKNIDGTYEEINTSEPIFAGEYKATLTYEDKVIEIEYEITEAIEDCENPDTGDGLIALIAIILIAVSCSVVLVNKYNKLMRI